MSTTLRYRNMRESKVIFHSFSSLANFNEKKKFSMFMLFPLTKVLRTNILEDCNMKISFTNFFIVVCMCNSSTDEAEPNAATTAVLQLSTTAR